MVLNKYKLDHLIKNKCKIFCYNDSDDYVQKKREPKWTEESVVPLVYDIHRNTQLA